MTAAPRLATLGAKTSRVQGSSTSVVAFVPLTSAWVRLDDVISPPTPFLRTPCVILPE